MQEHSVFNFDLGCVTNGFYRVFYRVISFALQYFRVDIGLATPRGWDSASTF